MLTAANTSDFRHPAFSLREAFSLRPAGSLPLIHSLRRAALLGVTALALSGCGFGFMDDMFSGRETNVLSRSDKSRTAALVEPPMPLLCMREGRALDLDDATCARVGGAMVRMPRPGGAEKAPEAVPVAAVTAEPLGSTGRPGGRLLLPADTGTLPPPSAGLAAVPPVSPPDVREAIGRNGLRTREALAARQAQTPPVPAPSADKPLPGPLALTGPAPVDAEAWTPSRVLSAESGPRPLPPAIGLTGLDPASVHAPAGASPFAADVQSAEQERRPPAGGANPGPATGAAAATALASADAGNAGSAGNTGNRPLVEFPAESDAPPLGAPMLRGLSARRFENVGQSGPFGGVFQSLAEPD